MPILIIDNRHYASICFLKVSYMALHCIRFRIGIPIGILFFFIASCTNYINDTDILNYRSFSAELYTSDKRLAGIALRKFSQNNKEYYLAVDPQTLQTEIIPTERYLIVKMPFREIRARNKNLNYFKAINRAEKNSRVFQNAGITHIAGRGAVYLTADLCPTGRPLDRSFFTDLIREYGTYRKPVPLSLSITGRWMENHPNDLKWIISLEKQKEISITWINHTNSHYYKKNLPLLKNFLLSEGSRIDDEILQVETRLIESGIPPTVFFRFPGLVSTKEVFLQVTDFGLIPVGSDAWLMKNQQPAEGSIILVHANGNEPGGIQRLRALVQKKKKDIMNGRWVLRELREGINESMKTY